MRRLHVRDGTRCRNTTSDGAVTVRRASPEDADAIDRLAALESTHLSGGPLLLAEVGHDIRAALSLSDGTVVADPFHPTAELVQLLQERAAEFAG